MHYLLVCRWTSSQPTTGVKKNKKIQCLLIILFFFLPFTCLNLLVYRKCTHVVTALWISREPVPTVRSVFWKAVDRGCVREEAGRGDESSTKFHSDPHSNLQSCLTVLTDALQLHPGVWDEILPKHLSYTVLVPVLVNCVMLIWWATILCVWEGELVTLRPSDGEVLAVLELVGHCDVEVWHWGMVTVAGNASSQMLQRNSGQGVANSPFPFHSSG